MAVMNINGDIAFPWKIPIWIIVSAKLLPPAVDMLSLDFHGFLGKVYDFMWYFIIIYSLEFFPSTLADGFSLESEWQQVSSSYQDTSQYSDRSQYSSRLVVSTRPPTSKSFNPLNNPLVTVPNVPITFGIIVTWLL